jgi:predicted ATPase
LKIAISGCAGIGKTTLATDLAEYFNVEIINESYERFFNENGSFISPPKLLQQKIIDVLHEKHKCEDKAGSFISDRCPIDLFNLWLSRGFAKNQKRTLELSQHCRAYVKKYDFIIVLPWGSIPLQQIDEHNDNRRRVMNPWTQFHNHSVIIGLCQQWVPSSKLLPVSGNLKNHKERLELVIKTLEKQEPSIKYPKAY